MHHQEGQPPVWSIGCRLKSGDKYFSHRSTDKHLTRDRWPRVYVRAPRYKSIQVIGTLLALILLDRQGGIGGNFVRSGEDHM